MARAVQERELPEQSLQPEPAYEQMTRRKFLIGAGLGTAAAVLAAHRVFADGSASAVGTGEATGGGRAKLSEKEAQDILGNLSQFKIKPDSVRVITEPNKNSRYNYSVSFHSSDIQKLVKNYRSQEDAAVIKFKGLSRETADSLKYILDKVANSSDVNRREFLQDLQGVIYKARTGNDPAIQKIQDLPGGVEELISALIYWLNIQIPPWAKPLVGVLQHRVEQLLKNKVTAIATPVPTPTGETTTTVTFKPVPTPGRTPNPTEIPTVEITPIVSLKLEKTQLDSVIAERFIAGGEYPENRKLFDNRVFKETKLGATIVVSQKAWDTFGNEGPINGQLAFSDWAQVLSKNDIKLTNNDFVVFDEGGKILTFKKKELPDGRPAQDVRIFTDEGIVSPQRGVTVAGPENAKWSDEYGLVGYSRKYDLITSIYKYDASDNKTLWRIQEYPIEANLAERAMQKRFEEWDRLNIDQRKTLISEWFDHLVTRGGMVGFSPDQKAKFRKYIPLLAYVKSHHDNPTKFKNNKEIDYPVNPDPIPMILFAYAKQITSTADPNVGGIANTSPYGMTISTGSQESNEAAKYLRMLAVIVKESTSNKVIYSNPKLSLGKIGIYRDHWAGINHVNVLRDIKDSNDPVIDRATAGILGNYINSELNFFDDASQY